jgi:hypothetical protein
LKIVEYLALPLSSASRHLIARRAERLRRRNKDKARDRLHPAPWQAGSPCGAAFGAREIQLPSGSMPTISLCACCDICRTSVLAIGLRHPILRLDEFIVGDARFESGDQRGIFGDGFRLGLAAHIGRVHGRTSGTSLP